MENEQQLEPMDLVPMLKRFFKSLRLLWVLVLTLTVLLGGFTFLRARSRYVPMYESRAVFSVTSGYGEGDVFTSNYHYDNAAASTLAAAFPHLLNTDMMRDLMLAELDKSYINGNITATSVADTSLFELRVRSSSPQDAYDILCAVIECYPQVAMIMVENPSVIIRQEPTIPTQPYNSFDPMNPLVRGGTVGLAIGLALVALAAMLNKTFTSPEDLKKAVNLPILATVPHVEAKKRSARYNFISAADDRGLAEALRGLRTKLRKQLSEKEGKIALVTSTIPNEGKSTLCVNLALSLAAEGHRVVLVDADLRHQTVHTMFGFQPGQKGLMECLNNPRMSALSCLRQVPDTGLYYLSGSSTNKRHYSIDAKAMRRVLDELSPRFDYILIDSPPCGVVSDTALLGRYADCVLYVIKQDYATQNQVLDAITGLYERDLPLTGCILNDVPRSLMGHYGYSYGYGYGYGKGSKYGK